MTGNCQTELLYRANPVWFCSPVWSGVLRGHTSHCALPWRVPLCCFEESIVQEAHVTHVSVREKLLHFERRDSKRWREKDSKVNFPLSLTIPAMHFCSAVPCLGIGTTYLRLTQRLFIQLFRPVCFKSTHMWVTCMIRVACSLSDSLGGPLTWVDLARKTCRCCFSKGLIVSLQQCTEKNVFRLFYLQQLPSALTIFRE